MAYALYAVWGPFAKAAAITVIDKQVFKKRADIVIDEVVDYSIPKISRKDFSFDWLKSYKADIAGDFVFSGFYLFIELKEILFVI